MTKVGGCLDHEHSGSFVKHFLLKVLYYRLVRGSIAMKTHIQLVVSLKCLVLEVKHRQKLFV